MSKSDSLYADYLIVGAGSAGCVLAYRLSADPSRKVILLEAGIRDWHPLIKIPAAFSKLYRSGVDYAHHSVAQPELFGRSLFIPRGRTLGGSGAINAMIYIRGHRDDYDGWAAMGNPGWGYEELLPLFRKSERSASTNTHLHGLDGLWNIETPLTIHPLSRIFLEAAQQTGYPIVDDLNDNVAHGVGIHPVNIQNGARHSPAHAFLRPAMHRANLSILTGARALHALWESGKVTGVDVNLGRRTRSIYATESVILCGGAIESPLFLMRSGIGDPEIIRGMQIPVRRALSGVGRNLQDHPVVPIAYRTHKGSSFDGEDTLANLIRWWWKREGPLCSNLCETGGFTRSQDDLRAPDLQYHFAPIFFVDHGFVRPKGNGISLAPILVQPQSRGIVSPAPNDHFVPWIDPAVYSNSSDLEKMVVGFHKARAIMEAPAFDGWRLEPYLPSVFLQSDPEVVEYLRRNTELLYHPVGTCRMGPDEDSVVDTELRVHGVDGLRVVDASIMPNITRGNTQAPTVLIAEKAAELMLR
ncbi:MAG: FAD-dependent oxidoreductase [Sphingomonadales bacterium]|nr:FAD-dependent oxidoreductase [Sphingomonadales bacterium]